MDVTIERLNEQIGWYDGKAAWNQKAYKRLKICTIAGAALVPALAAESALHWITAGLGVFVAVVEGIQQLYQFQSNWITYRSTCEALQREKHLYFAKAGRYADAVNPDVLLAETLESLLSQEQLKWTSSREKGEKPTAEKEPGATHAPSSPTRR